MYGKGHLKMYEFVVGCFLFAGFFVFLVLFFSFIFSQLFPVSPPRSVIVII